MPRAGDELIGHAGCQASIGGDSIGLHLFHILWMDQKRRTSNQDHNVRIERALPNRTNALAELRQVGVSCQRKSDNVKPFALHKRRYIQPDLCRTA